MKLNDFIFWLAVIFVGGEAIYGVYWSVLDIGLRLGFIPNSWAPGFAAILPTLDFTQEFIFFSHVALNLAALVALFRRWAGCIALFVLAVLLDRTDWIMFGLNPLNYTDEDLSEDAIVLIGHVGGIVMMMVLLQRGQLMGRLLPGPKHSG